MSISLVEYSASLQIGAVDFVAPNEIKVQLDIEAPDNVALNTGVPRPFPRINSYVLIHTEEGYIVCQIEWITIERSSYPKRKGFQDFGLIDLPYPLRKMSLNPIGTLSITDEDKYEFHRGVNAFPTVGDSVLLPTQKQLQTIIESGEKRRVKIGTSPLADNAEIKIDPDRLFGRHLAVLGNTGSGKSCSVAGIIRWSLEQAAKEKLSRNKNATNPNARFIVLDPNGEYRRAFADFKSARFFSVEPPNDNEALNIPLWFWNSSEWCAFTQASGKTQRPTLINALRSVRDGVPEITESKKSEMKHFLQTLITTTQLEKKAGSPWGRFPAPKNFLEKIDRWNTSLETDDSFTDAQNVTINSINEIITALVNARGGSYPNYNFTLQEINNFLDVLKNAHGEFGGSDEDFFPLDADIPLPFNGDDFIRTIDACAEILGTSEYIDTMQARVKTLLSDTRMKKIINDKDNITLYQWLSKYIGDDNASNGTVSIIDLSLVPAEIVHIITAVIARMAFESMQRYRKKHIEHKSLPTVLVMEEAHIFIKRYNEDSENQTASEICCRVFERIAREGRKFGLGLVLSSQRPSELSPTVLSQCNTFILHRINNDRDQELVSKLIPDNLRGLLRDLPSLPSQNAILLGWAAELPLLVRMRNLPEKQRPQSDDPDFWDVWTGCQERNVNWKEIANDWQQRDNTSSTNENLEPSSTNNAGG